MTISAHKKHVLSSALALAALMPLQAATADDYLLEIDSVKGDSQVKEFQGSIDLLSWSWGASSPDGKSTCAQDLSVAKNTDSSTDDLVNALDAGLSFSTARLSMVRSGDSGLEIYHTILLRNLTVTSYSIGGSDGGGAPVEQLSFGYSEAEGRYFPTEQDGPPEPVQEYFITPGKCN